MKEINRIFLFGDSWVEGQGAFVSMQTLADGKIQFYENGLQTDELREWRRHNTWNKFLKKYIESDIVNFATQGSSNYAQFKELNSILDDLRDSDLVLFGFTSKYRDTYNQINYAYSMGTKLIHNNNPIRNTIAYEKKDINTQWSFRGVHDTYNSDFERNFTKNQIQEFFVKIFDERVYENIAQNNYLFYQNWFKQKGLNIIFFDLFEQYINPMYVNEFYDVDTSTYITYEKDTMHQTLLKYEKENYTKDSPFTIWEWPEVKFPPIDTIYHPNQFGYEYYVEWLWENYLSKQYKFIGNAKNII